jgi:putative pyruvate formate lyase activating enzyme
VYCQNWDISQEGEGRTVSPDELANMMLALQAIGCHNINLVSPSHVVAQILAAVARCSGPPSGLPAKGASQRGGAIIGSHAPQGARGGRR